MKKNKNNTYEKGSVGEFIELLKEFPADGKIDLNGNVSITKETEDGEISEVTIHPQCAEYRNDECECKDECPDLESEDSIEGARESYASHIMNKYDIGFYSEDPKRAPNIRYNSADRVLGAPIMVPHEGALEYEESYLLPNQRALIDEIRHHNVYMAECMAEICRRGISAMLEYNTQILSHFAHETSIDMCKIIDKGTAGKVLKCIDDEE